MHKTFSTVVVGVFVTLMGCSSAPAPKAPTASIGGPYTGHTSASIAFSGSGSSDPQGQVLTYAWNFGDGGSGTGVSPTHTYASAGSYSVSLSVSDTSGLSSLAATTTATVTNQTPTASAGGPYSAAPSSAIVFSAAASSDPQGTALTYNWSFGDSTMGSGVAPTHTYTSTGSYTVTLTVTDILNLSATTTTTATVAAQAPAANAGGSYSASIGSPINFSAAKSTDPNGQPLSYAWNFGDGTTGTGVSPSHFYTAAGSFTATVTVSDAKYSLNSTSSATVTSTQVAIQPATTVVVNTSGYFIDPMPIQLAPGSSTAVQYFAGTPSAGFASPFLSCTLPIQPGCFTSTPITVDNSPVQAMAKSSGSTVGGAENDNIYQDASGNWQMAITVFVTNPNQTPATNPGQVTNNWTVVCHAHPTNTGSPVPTAWQIDTVLEGSLATYALGNYDGKYFFNAGSLYLFFSKTLASSPMQQDGVVAQLMTSATQVSSSAPIVMVAPDTTANNGSGFNSEYRNGLNPAVPTKLVETGNITMVNGEYVIAYSAGSYQLRGYKASFAWSDTFLPSSPAGYQKQLMIDSAGVWGTPGETEVNYVLQSQIAQWPNYVAAQVLAPGVPSIVNENGTYYLFFAGYNPSDAPQVTGGFDGGHRRPFYTPLQIAIPAGASVANTSPFNLSTWITPVAQ